MKLYVFTYRREAHEVIYVEAENAIDAKRMADKEEEEIDWDKSDYEKFSWYSDEPSDINHKAYEAYQSKKAVSKLRGFN